MQADVIHSLLRQLASTGSGPDTACRRTSDGGLAIDDLLLPAHINPSSILASHPDNPKDEDSSSRGFTRSTRLSRLTPLKDAAAASSLLAIAGAAAAAGHDNALSRSPPAITQPQQLCFDTIADALNIVLAPGLLGMAAIMYPSPGAAAAGGVLGGDPGSSLGLCNSGPRPPCEPAPASLSFQSGLPCEHTANSGGAPDACALLRWDRGGGTVQQPYGASMDSAWHPSDSSAPDMYVTPAGGLRSNSSCGGGAAAAGAVGMVSSGSDRHDHFGAMVGNQSSLPVSAYTTPTPDLQLQLQGMQQQAEAALLSAPTARPAPTAEGPASMPAAAAAQALQTRPASMRRQGGGRRSASGLSLAGILAALRSHARSSSCDGTAPPSGGGAAAPAPAASAGAAAAAADRPQQQRRLSKSREQQLQEARTLSPQVLLHMHQQLAAATGGSVGSRAPPQTPTHAVMDSPFRASLDLASLPAATMAYLNTKPAAVQSPVAPPQPPPALLPPPPVIEDVERLLARADDWCFDTWALDEATQGHALSALGFYLLQRQGLLSKLGLDPLVVARCMGRTSGGHRLHTACATQTPWGVCWLPSLLGRALSGQSQTADVVRGPLLTPAGCCAR